LGVNIGLPEILVIALIVLLIFGGRWIPSLGRALGSGYRNLRDQVGRRSADKQVERGERSSSEPGDDL
jgi:sec-independent protein translocase protein TatA